MPERKSSQAKIDANQRYAAKTYKRYFVNVHLEFVPQIEDYKIKQGILSDSGIFYAAIKYCIENDIDLSNYINLNNKESISE